MPDRIMAALANASIHGMFSSQRYPSMPTERDTAIIKAPAARLRATRRAKRPLEMSGWLWRSYMGQILALRRFARCRPRLSRPCRRPPTGSHRRKTLATEESASAWPAPRGFWARPGTFCARLRARARLRSRARPRMPAPRAPYRDPSRATRARCAPLRICVKARGRAIPRSARRTGACVATGLPAALRVPPRDWRTPGASRPARLSCARAARAAAGPARVASAAFSHLGGDGCQCLRILDAELLADLAFDLGGELRVFLQEVAGVVLALSDAVLLVPVPGPGLVDHAATDAELQDLAFEGHPFAVENIEQRFAERRRDLVLHDLHAGLGADHLVAALDTADAPDVEAARRVELERVAAGGRLGVAEHDADLHADLVDEDDERVGALDVGGELPQRLAHQPRLQTHLRLAHFALDLGLRRERRDRIDHDHVDRPGAHQHVGDFERLLAGVGLGNQKLLDLDA